MNQLLFAFLFCLCFAFSLVAQQPHFQISGKITDAKNEPLIGAKITVTQQGKQPLVVVFQSDEDGMFAWACDTGNYNVRVNFIGMTEFSKNNIKVSPDKPKTHLHAVLDYSEQLLSGVEITAGRELVHDNADKKTFEAAKSLNTIGANAEDLLVEVPTLSTDVSTNIFMRGSQNVQVLINGKPSGLLGGNRQSMLRNIPASAIERIEVWPSPGADNDANGMSGIINIVLKKGKQYGFHATGTANLSADNRLDASLAANYGFRKASVYATFSQRNNQSDGIIKTTRVYTRTDPDTTYYFVSTQPFIRNTQTRNIHTGFSYEPHNNHLIEGSFIGNYTKATGEDTKAEVWRTQEHATTKMTMKAVALSNYSRTFDSNLSYRYNWGERQANSLQMSILQTINLFDNNNLTITIPYTRDSLPKGTGTLMDKFQSVGYAANTVAKTLVEQRLSSTTSIKYGAQGTIIKFENDYRNLSFDFPKLVWQRDEKASTVFQYSETTLAAFAQANGTYIKKLNWSAGLRGESTTTLSELHADATSLGNQYTKLYPNASLTYQLREKHALDIRYNYRVNRPSYEMLNPFVDYLLPTNATVGNPALKPEFAHSLELGYIYKSKKLKLHPAVFGRKVRDIISRITLENPDITNFFTYANLGNAYNYGTELTASWQAGKNTLFNGNIAYYRTHYLDTVLLTLSLPGQIWQSRLTLMQNVGKKTVLQLAAYYNSRWSWVEGTSRPTYYLDAAIKHTLGKSGWAAVLRVNDVFSTRRYNMTAIGTASTNLLTQQRDTRIVYLGLVNDLHMTPKTKPGKTF